MDPKRKVTILKDDAGTMSAATSTRSTRPSDTLFDPQPGTSSGIFKIPKTQKDSKKRDIENPDEDPVVKRMRIGRDIREVTPKNLKDFPEGIILRPSGIHSVTKSILCTPAPSKDEDVLIIDVSAEEIADILDDSTVEDEPNFNDHRLIKKYIGNIHSSATAAEIQKMPMHIYTDKEDQTQNVEEVQEEEHEIPEDLIKDPTFDVIDLTTDEELEEERENLQAHLVDKYVEGLAEERFAPDFKWYKSTSLRNLSPKPSVPQDEPEEEKEEDDFK